MPGIVFSTFPRILFLVIFANLFFQEVSTEDSECIAKYGDICDPKAIYPFCNNDNFICKRSDASGLFIYVEIDHLGKHCKDDSECAKISNAVCSKENICVCKSNYIHKPYNSTCLPLLGENCSNYHECAPENSECFLDECRCKPRYLKILNNQCEPFLLGHSCRTSEDCGYILNAECSEDNECVCKSDYIATSMSTCGLRLGKYCDKNTADCLRNAICLDNTCHCKEMYLPGPNDECFPNFRHLECVQKNDKRNCKHDNYLFCLKEGTCICQHNYILANEVFCEPLLNENCTESQSCAVENSICFNNVCKCKSNFISKFNNRCVAKFLFESCNSDLDCSEIRHSRCSQDKVCVCKRKYIASNKQVCTLAPKGYCTNDKDCKIENSICFNHECKCGSDFGPISDRHCLPLISNNFCNDDKDCIHIPHAECSVHNVCTCKSNYTAVNGTVICASLLGGDCSRDQDCYTKNSMCSVSKCECQKWYRALSQYRCEPYILGKSCEEDNDCINNATNAVCSKSKVCVCRNNYFFEHGVCKPTERGVCSVDKPCHRNFHCFDGRCQCGRNSVTVSKSQCRPRLSTIICDKDLDCGDPWHSKCSKRNYCKCKQNNKLIDGVTCAPLIGGLCWKNSQCIVENSVCMDFHCQCIKPIYEAISDNYCKQLM